MASLKQRPGYVASEAQSAELVARDERSLGGGTARIDGRVTVYALGLADRWLRIRKGFTAKNAKGAILCGRRFTAEDAKSAKGAKLIRS
jgi:hypothetical protein